MEKPISKLTFSELIDEIFLAIMFMGLGAFLVARFIIG